MDSESWGFAPAMLHFYSFWNTICQGENVLVNQKIAAQFLRWCDESHRLAIVRTIYRERPLDGELGHEIERAMKKQRRTSEIYKSYIGKNLNKRTESLIENMLISDKGTVRAALKRMVEPLFMLPDPFLDGKDLAKTLILKRKPGGAEKAEASLINQLIFLGKMDKFIESFVNERVVYCSTAGTVDDILKGKTPKFQKDAKKLYESMKRVCDEKELISQKNLHTKIRDALWPTYYYEQARGFRRFVELMSQELLNHLSAFISSPEAKGYKPGEQMKLFRD